MKPSASAQHSTDDATQPRMARLVDGERARLTFSVHATHLDDREVLRLAKSGAIAGLCPTTEANLGDGVFPAPGFLSASGRFGIGTDSHVVVSVVEELRMLEYGQRLMRHLFGRSQMRS